MSISSVSRAKIKNILAPLQQACLNLLYKYMSVFEKYRRQTNGYNDQASKSEPQESRVMRPLFYLILVVLEDIIFDTCSEQSDKSLKRLRYRKSLHLNSIVLL